MKLKKQITSIEHQISKIEGEVENFITKHVYGFTQPEMKTLLQYFPSCDIARYNDAMIGNTGMFIDGEFITYRVDVITALYCGLEDRSRNFLEFD